MSVLNFILMTSVISSVPSNSSANDKNKADAINAVAKALYVEHNLDDKIKKLEEKYVPESIRKNPWIIVTTKMMIEQKISYQISF